MVELRGWGSEGGFDSEAWEGEKGGEKGRFSPSFDRSAFTVFFFCLDTQARFMYSIHMPARCIRAGWGVGVEGAGGSRKRIIRVL